MKTTIKFLCILTSLLIITTACSKDDEPMNEAPKAFTVTPIVTGNLVTIDWNEAIDPEGRTITYNVEMNGQTVASNKTTTSYTFSDLTYATTFTGKVIAYDDEGLTSEASFSFETEMRPNTAPTAAVLSAPSANEQSVSVTAELTWTAATDAENDGIVYDVYLDETSNPTTKIAENLTNTSYQLTTTLNNTTTYHWKVISKDAFDAETESTVSSFTTRDLATGTQITANASFEERLAHSTVSFDNKMWVIGGRDCCGGRFKDIWYSSDGENWTEATDNAPFGLRSQHATVVFDNKMWVIGGDKWYSAGNELNDVWYTEDGINWVQATANANFEPRIEHRVVVFDNKMWLFGGRNYSATLNENQVWNSEDGVTWTKVTQNAGISFATTEFAVFNNKIWRVSDYNDSNVYSSTDGNTWSLEAENVSFGQRVEFQVAVWDNKIWLVGGSDRNLNIDNPLPDVWYSEDGKDWKLASADAGISATRYHTLTVHDNKIWKIGGFKGNTIYNDVWTIGY